MGARKATLGAIAASLIATAAAAAQPVAGPAAAKPAIAPASAITAAELKPGDVLVSDDKHGGVIDRYRPSNGSFAIFTDNSKSLSAGGQADLAFPIGMTFDSKGRVLVADRDFHGVIAVNPKTGAEKAISDNQISVNAGGDAAFAEPSGIAVDRHGTIWVSDFGSIPSVIKVNPKTGAAHTVSSDSSLANPYDLALSGGGAFVTSDHSIVHVALPSGGQHVFVHGHGLKQPAGIVRAPHGTFLVADQAAKKLYSVNKKTGHVTTVSADSHLKAPFGLAIGLDGFDYVADFDVRALFQVNPKTGKAKPVVKSGLDNPLGVAVVPH